MAVIYTWGRWEEEWLNGQFRCVFVESQSRPNSIICATGLYRAVDGDILYDLDTYRDTILDRAAIIAGDSGEMLVRTEFAELLALMPAFLQELTERFNEMSLKSPQPMASRDQHDMPLSNGGCRTRIGPRKFFQ